MSDKGFDADGPIPPEAVKENGGVFVIRYVSDFPSKNISADEFRGYRDAGLAVALTAENGINDWTMNPAEAKAFGQRCRYVATQAGFSPSRPIYATIDTELDESQFPQALAYLLNFASGARSAPAAYVQQSAAQWLMDRGVKYIFTSAGYLGGPECNVQLMQDRESWYGPFIDYVDVGGTQCDTDYAFAADYGQDPAPVIPPPPPPHTGDIISVKLPILQPGDRGYAVRNFQILLNFDYPEAERVIADGLFGEATEALLKRYQADHGQDQTGYVTAETYQSLFPA